MSVYDYETNPTKELEGVDVPVSKNKDGTTVTFKIASSGGGNKPYQKGFEEFTKPFQRIGIDAMGDDAADVGMRELFVDHCIKGWKNVQSKEGEEIPYTRENAIQLMIEIPRLYQYLQQQANSLALFKDAQKEEAAKN